MKNVNTQYSPCRVVRYDANVLYGVEISKICVKMFQEFISHLACLLVHEQAPDHMVSTMKMSKLEVVLDSGK